MAWVFLHPPRRIHRRTPRTALGLAYERFSLRASDGVRLSAWFIPATPATAPRGVVVLAHGYHGNRHTMLPYVRFLHEAGYSVLTFDFRAHGWSGGRRTTFGVHEAFDLQAALDWVFDNPELAGLPVALLGESMGASVALLVAAEEPRVGAVVADSGFARFDSAVSGRFSSVFGERASRVLAPPTQKIGERILGLRCEEIAPVEALPRLAPRPVLLIHGTADDFILPENADALYAASPEHTTLWKVKGGQHCTSVFVAGREYARRVTRFLDDALPRPQGEAGSGGPPP
jgi:Dipeptidyl aminopeptidases/acylaminoacyl-peptidases